MVRQQTYLARADVTGDLQEVFVGVHMVGL
jgi:hypothetical protein